MRRCVKVPFAKFKPDPIIAPPYVVQCKAANAPIQFSGSDETNCFPVKGSEVNIVTSKGNHDGVSSMLKIKNIVNFGWEHKCYPGQLVASHMSGTYIAYAITTSGKGCGVVRVTGFSSRG